MRNNLLNGFTILILVVCLLNLILNMINGRFWLSDFHVYYSAAVNFLSGSKVYMESFDSGSGFYKYSPAMLLFFIPFTLISFKSASILFFFILGFAFWFDFILIRDMWQESCFKENLKKPYLLLSLSFLPVVIFFSRELLLGNINVILLLLCCLSAVLMISGKEIRAGILLSIVIIAKPYFVLLLIPLIVRKKLKALFSTVVFISAWLIIPFLLSGFSRGAELYTGWINTMLTHDTAYPTRNSIGYLLQHYFFPSMPGFIEYLLILAICGVFSFFVFSNIKREKPEGINGMITKGNFTFEWFLLIALLPNLVKTDWVQFLLTTPILTFIIFSAGAYRIRWLIPVLGVVLFFFGANSDDLLGRDLSHRLFIMGLMGISNLILIAISLFLFYKYHPSKALNT